MRKNDAESEVKILVGKVAAAQEARRQAQLRPREFPEEQETLSGIKAETRGTSEHLAFGSNDTSLSCRHRLRICRNGLQTSQQETDEACA